MKEWYIVSMILIIGQCGETMADNTPAEVNNILNQVTVMVNSIIPGIQVQSQKAISQVQDNVNAFQTVAAAAAQNVKSTTATMNSCAMDQINSTVPSDVYNPFNTCVSYYINSANLMTSTIRTKISSLLNDYTNYLFTSRSSCLTQSTNTAQIMCLLQLTATFSTKTNQLVATINQEVSSAQQTVSVYQTYISSCVTNNVLSVANSLLTLGVNPNTCNLDLPSYVGPNLSDTLQQYSDTVNQINANLQNTLNTSLTYLNNLQNSFDSVFQIKNADLQNLITNVILCGSNQGINNIPVTIFNPVLDCFMENQSNNTNMISGLQTWINNTILAVQANTFTFKNTCMSLATVFKQVDCLTNATNGFTSNYTILVNSINVTLLTANESVASLKNNLTVCSVSKNSTVISNAQAAGVDFTKCNPTTTTTPLVDLNAARLSFNATVSRVNSALQNGSITSQNILQMAINKFTSDLIAANGLSQQLIQNITQCARSQNITNLGLSVFFPITNCINWTNSTVQNFIPVWMNTFPNIVQSAEQEIANQGLACLQRSTPSLVVACLNSSATNYQNNLVLILNDFQNLVVAANATIQNVDASLGMCYPNGLNSVFNAVQGVGVDANLCWSPTTTSTTPIIDVNAAKSSFDSRVNTTNALLQSRYLLNSNALQGNIASFMIDLRTANDSVNSLISSIMQCAQLQNISNVTSAIFNPITGCVTNANNEVTSSIPSWTASLNNAIQTPQQNIQNSRSSCLLLTTSQAIVQCLNNAITTYVSNQQTVLDSLDSILTSAAGTIRNWDGIVSKCYPLNINSVMASVSGLGINYNSCVSTTASTTTTTTTLSPISDIDVALRNFNAAVAQTNSLLQNGSQSALTELQIIVNNYRTALNGVNGNLQSLITKVQRCGQTVNVTNVPQTLFTPISSCISLAGGNAEPLIPIWNDTIISSSSVVNQNVMIQKNTCLSFTTTPMVVQCLNNAVITYRNNVATVLNDYRSVIDAARTTLQMFSTVITMCYSNSYNAVVSAIKNIRIDLSQCAN